MEIPDQDFLPYAQVIPSPPISLAAKATILSSRLPFNMSVTSLREYKTSGSGKPRYGLPDAPLAVARSSPLVSPLLRRPGSPTLFVPFAQKSDAEFADSTMA